MRVTVVKYERVVNLGNFENERLGVEIVLAEEDSAQEAFEAAFRTVEDRLPGFKRVRTSPEYETDADAVKAEPPEPEIP